MKKYRIVCVLGTRPEVLKMASVIKCLRENDGLNVKVVLTAQHRDLLDQMLNYFEIDIDYDFNIFKNNQALNQISAKLLNKFEHYLSENSCDLLVAQGDTTSTMISALAAFHKQLPFAHIEAGLRTFDISNPFPEELNRKIISMISTLHFCPTLYSKENLKNEGIHKNVFVTGNSVIDSLCQFSKSLNRTENNREKVILVTCHRRENFGLPILYICDALKKIITMYSDVRIVFPVHPNPNIKNVIFEQLDGIDRIELLPPLGYKQFLELLANCYLVLTDSGGVQEEAPVFKKPVLILRTLTERQEGVDYGVAKLVGLNSENIVKQVTDLIVNPDLYEKMKNSSGFIYGDGRAGYRIAKIIEFYLSSNEKLIKANALFSDPIEQISHSSLGDLIL